MTNAEIKRLMADLKKGKRLTAKQQMSVLAWLLKRNQQLLAMKEERAAQTASNPDWEA